MEDIEAISWKNAHEDDLWVFDKLIVSRKLGYVCGPVGVDVPTLGTYIVRPCVNIPGMGRGAEIVHIEKETFHLPPGHFWCELFNGSHISVDYKNGEQVLAVEGIRTDKQLWRFYKWKKIKDIIPIPSIFYSLTKKYEYINIEYIGGNAIEVHFRYNPDFVHGNSVAYPVWNDQQDNDFEFARLQGLRYVEAPDYHRKGFWID
jgi:hypothetical protein